MNNEINKVIVFDLDHTIGDFFIIGMIWNFMKKIKLHLNQRDFNDICSLFPNILRYNIIPILNYICVRKTVNNTIKIIVYSNNKKGIDWIKMIVTYIQYKVNYKIFFKVIENDYKSYKNLLIKTGIPKTAKILFIDDFYHSQMNHDKVVYLNIKPYNYYIPNRILIDTFTTSKYFYNKILNNDKLNVVGLFKKYIEINNINKEKKKEEKKVDSIVSKMILNHIQRFLNENDNKTRKNRKPLRIHR
tara:strand:- start:138 stop:872 length:735 start_codon:yes stop_codon:yes gene_type:complete